MTPEEVIESLVDKAYNSKYKDAADSENQRTVDFRDRLNEFVESFDELAKAS